MEGKGDALECTDLFTRRRWHAITLVRRSEFELRSVARSFLGMTRLKNYPYSIVFPHRMCIILLLKCLYIAFQINYTVFKRTLITARPTRSL
jgi:hypothetical protein